MLIIDGATNRRRFAVRLRWVHSPKASEDSVGSWQICERVRSRATESRA